MDGDDWAPPKIKAVNAGALAGKRGALADGHYDALLTVGVRRDAPVDAITAALRQAAVSAGLDTIESEKAGYLRASGVVLRAGDALRAAALLRRSRRVAACAPSSLRKSQEPGRHRVRDNARNAQVAVRVARRGARNGDACARRVATAVRAVFADADLREADDAAPRRRAPSGAASDSEECGPGHGGLDAGLGQLDAAARDPAFAAHEHRAAWLGAAARRAERVAQQACAAMGFAAPETASPPPPPPPKAVQPPPPTRRGCLRGAHAAVAARGARPGRGTSGRRRTNRGRGGLARVRRTRRGGEGSRPGVGREAPAEQAAGFAPGAGAGGRATSGHRRRRGRRGGSSRLRARLARAPARRRRAPRRVSRRVFFVATGVLLDDVVLAVLRAVCVK